MKNICLNMIVRNESKIIKRCLTSLLPWIDAWAIIDTGSTDGTQQIILDTMEGVAGKLLERPWVDFKHNRNEALALSRELGDYSLFIDADEQFFPNPGFSGFPTQEKAYFLNIQERSSVYQKIFLIDHSISFSWVGVLHECLEAREAIDTHFFEKGYYLSNTLDGYRSKDPDKYTKDAAILEKALEKEPRNERYLFYLGQSYHCAGELQKALAAFEQRALLDGNRDETFFAVYSVGLMHLKLGNPKEEYLKAFRKAHLLDPRRPEPIYYLSVDLFEKREYGKVCSLLREHVISPLKSAAYFLSCEIAEIHLPLVFAKACYLLGNYQEAHDTLKKVLLHPFLPDSLKIRLNEMLNELILEHPRALCSFEKSLPFGG